MYPVTHFAEQSFAQTEAHSRALSARGPTDRAVASASGSTATVETLGAAFLDRFRGLLRDLADG